VTWTPDTLTDATVARVIEQSRREVLAREKTIRIAREKNGPRPFLCVEFKVISRRTGEVVRQGRAA
jgi:hypothetical protein